MPFSQINFNGSMNHKKNNEGRHEENADSLATARLIENNNLSAFNSSNKEKGQEKEK